LLAGGLVGLSAALITLLDPGSLFETAELKGLDLHFAVRGAEAPAAPVVIIAIDEDSFDELNLPWPWPRALHGQLIDTVNAARPAAIGLDLVFAEPSLHGPDDDQALSDAVSRAGNVVLGAALTEVREPQFVKHDLNPPVRPVRDGAAGVGVVGFHPDADAFVRRAPVTHRFQDRDVDGFDVSLYRLAARNGLEVASLPPAAEVLINFRGGPRSYPRVPYHRVLSGEVPPDTFAGRLVLVGPTSPVLHDSFPTPFAARGQMPGVEIHANALETLLRGIAIRTVPAAVGPAAAVGAGLLAAWLAIGVRSALGAAGAVFGCAAAGLVLAHAAFAGGRLWIPVVPALLALLSSYGVTVVRNFIREQREKRRLSRYFSPAVVSEIVRQQDDRRLGSTRRRVTVLFSDIRGFTSFSEKLPPEDVVRFLREYLTVMTAVVFRHGGTVDKYVGDAIMALYNVPFDQPDHAARAVETALEFQDRVRDLGERFAARGGRILRCGVGINTGDAVVGTIGSEQRLEYTAIGDTINLGSRLEGLTKDVDVPIVISESTYLEVRDRFETRALGEVTVRGKEIPVKIYAIVGPSASRAADPHHAALPPPP
jgi:adenylate cyclase